MSKDRLLDPQMWWHHLLSDPLAAIADAYRAMMDWGLLDVSALWRQFYDDAVPVTDLHWRSVLIYVIGCSVFFILLVRNKRVVSSFRSFGRAILPQEVTASESFKIDVQFYIATLLKIPQIMKIGGMLLLVSVQQHLVSYNLYHLPVLHYASDAIAGLAHWARVLVAYAVALIAFEFGYYWAHRWSHKSRLLWQFHKVHHYSRQLNLLTGIKHHPFDDLLQGAVAGLTMVFAMSLFFDHVSPHPSDNLSEPYWLALAVSSTTTVLNRFSHTHIGFSLGRTLDRVFVTPAVHTLHHSRGFQDANYGNFISIWDVAFGTFRAHETGSKVNVGISEFDDDHYRNLVHLLLEPCVDALRLLRLWPTPRRSAVGVPGRS
jgi:sterol desaturase/sphingolipid hydroxylase (fatty acid hydroxylase superfamily)